VVTFKIVFIFSRRTSRPRRYIELHRYAERRGQQRNANKYLNEKINRNRMLGTLRKRRLFPF
jgi:hypothetical protein